MICLDSFSPDRGFGDGGPSAEVLKRLSQVFSRISKLVGIDAEKTFCGDSANFLSKSITF